MCGSCAKVLLAKSKDKLRKYRKVKEGKEKLRNAKKSKEKLREAKRSDEVKGSTDKLREV